MGLYVACGAMPLVEKDAAGHDRINRVTYEVAVLEALRERLRCKEIWVVGANRYRNPDEDLPADLEANRDEYYKALELPLDAERFISQVQDEMRQARGRVGGTFRFSRIDIRMFEHVAGGNSGGKASESVVTTANHIAPRLDPPAPPNDRSPRLAIDEVVQALIGTLEDQAHHRRPW
jgi:hypothetical protein